MVLYLDLKEFDAPAVKYQYHSLLPQIYTEHSYTSAFNLGAGIKGSLACYCSCFRSAILCPKHFNLYALMKGQGYPLIMCYGLDSM